MVLINVKDLGANGNDDGTDSVARLNREIIQKAINQAIEPLRDANGQIVRYPPPEPAPIPKHKDGVVIYFPAGRYIIKGGPIMLPRLPFNRTVTIKGDGMTVSQIVGPDSVSDAENVAIFVANPHNDPNDPDSIWYRYNHAIGYAFEDLTLGVGFRQNAFRWDVQVPSTESRPGDNPNNPLDPGRRLGMVFQRVLFTSAYGASKPLVHIRGGQGVSFMHCLFQGPNGPPTSTDKPVALNFLSSSGVSVINCRTIGRMGGMMHVKGGGEMVVMASRSEGINGVPAWKFEDAAHISLTNLGNEGEMEDPAIFQFVRCRNVMITNPGIATPDGSIRTYTDANGVQRARFGDGILFQSCTNCHIMGVHSGGYSGLGDGLARLVRVDRDSAYITGIGITTNSAFPEREVDIQGRYCSFEIVRFDAAVSERRVVKIST